MQIFDVRGPDDLASVFATPIRARSDALFVRGPPWLFTYRAQPIAFAAQHHLSASYAQKEWVAAGGLMSYGPSLEHAARRVAVCVDKVLKGANPGEIPIEQPTTFDFAVNSTTLQALGLTIPPDVAAQVTEWVP
jgi:putative ABC transport system substrate-binding protein